MQKKNTLDLSLVTIFLYHFRRKLRNFTTQVVAAVFWDTLYYIDKCRENKIVCQ